MACQVELLLREKRCEEIERHAVADAVRCAAVDGLNLDEREVLLAIFRRTDGTRHGVTCLQAEQFNL